MEFLRPLPILAFLSVVVVVSHASLPSEGYWKLVLPHTPMPKAVKDHLRPGVTSFNASAAGCFGIHNQFNKIPQPFHAKQAQDGLNTGNFFLQTDLHPGTKMMLQLPQTRNEAMFLPRQVADSIPFSSKKLPEILNRLSVKEKSAEAELMKEEIEECEEDAWMENLGSVHIIRVPNRFQHFKARKKCECADE
ncbi:BURP domain-containing protein 7 [Vitis vinifera]|uniref:BURP domain-containing protein 7 n=1 Tax=Vitis vinifera TaxID=29760 RepID=A0A438G317_VITVI|nr:BURP domain-containing protein 7 [Vitis vinifera]